MKIVSKSVPQNASQKAKTHRFRTEISRKIIAFEEVSDANKDQSSRKINRLLKTPNSTMQTWVKKGQ